MPGSERFPRALLPRVSPDESITLELTSELLQGSQDAIVPGRTRQLPGARSNIRSACLACRQRRSKCSGGALCGRCRTRGTDCVYEELQDRRTRAVREKGKEELDLHRKVIDGVFKAIRTGGDQAILDLVRQNASLQDIATAVGDYSEDSDSDSDNQALCSLTSSWDAERGQCDGSMGTTQLASQTHARRNVHGRDEDAMYSSFTNKQSESLTPIMGIPSHEPLLFPYMLKPLHGVHLSNLDNLSNFYIHFRQSCQQMIAKGIPAEAIIGPPAISCNLLFRANQNPETFNLSTWASNIVNDFPEVDGYFKLAWFVLLIRFMRWCIKSTEESFDMVPNAIKPTILQLSTPHAPYIDLVPLPKIRDSLIKNTNDFTTALQIAGASVGWQASFEEAVHHDPITGNMTITDRFEEHAANADHYRFGGFFLRSFPDLKNQINIAEQDRITAVPFVSGSTWASLL